MKKYIRKCIAIILIEIIILGAINLLYIFKNVSSQDRLYRVYAKRIEQKLKKGEEFSSIDLSDFDGITGLGPFDIKEKISDDYMIISGSSEDELYYVSYQQGDSRFTNLLWINVVYMMVMIVSVISFAYIGNTIIKPFSKIVSMPYELSKGNLVVPVKEEKNKIFGKFLWGMDLLRDNLEKSKSEELRLQKEKKTLVLSISHDIKTPLSSIKLYAKALEENLYEDDAKKTEVYKGISNNARDIEKYVNEIIKASREDFLNLKVVNERFYLKDAIDSINELYKDKLEPLNTKWTVGEYDNNLLYGDKERLIEVLQNIIENAIKYGDGEAISLTVSEEEDCKLIRIENTGNPVDPDELPNIFDSFYRGSNVNEKEGNGLGLYICKTLMNKMDGDIFAENIGDGTAITVVVRK